jgi:hypothetical protein
VPIQLYVGISLAPAVDAGLTGGRASAALASRSVTRPASRACTPTRVRRPCASL